MLTIRPLLFNLILLLPALLWAQEAEPDVSADDLPRIEPKSPQEELATFALKPGLRLELVASEPLIEDPIAINFAPDGSLFVCEMRGYSERRDEALGRVSRLTDTNQDGVYDKATVYTDGLMWPTGVIPWDGGVFVIATPDLWYCKDTNGDGVADERQVIFTGFAEGAKRLNVQALANCLNWGPDHRIYGATAGNGGKLRRPDQPESEALNLRGSDFSFDPRKLDLRAEPGTAQYGLTFDDFGQRYVCSNSRHILAVAYTWPWNERANLPSPLVSIPDDGGAAEVFRTSEVEPWRVVRTRWRVQGLVRGPVEGGGRASGYFTSASGLGIYRGTALGDGFRGNLFVGDVGSNLVHRKLIQRSEVAVELVATRPQDEQEVEFLTSTDNWFRPVQCTNGPDGGLYIVDMYREIIEHPWSLPETIKTHLDLNSGNHLGRIWRVVAEDFERPELPDLMAATPQDLVALLEHPDGWIRDAAQVRLHELQNRGAIPALETLLAESPSPTARYAALHSIVALGGNAASATQLARQDPDARVRALAQKLSPQPDWELATTDPNAWVRYETALRTLDPSFEQTGQLAAMLEAAEGDTWISQVIAESAKSKGAIAETLAGQSDLALTASLLESLRFRKPTTEQVAALRPLFDRAQDTLADSDAAPEQLQGAVRILTLNPGLENPELWSLIDAGDPDLARLALEGLMSRGAKWQADLLSRWSKLPAAVKTLAINQISDPQLLDALEAETLGTSEIDFRRRQALQTHRDETLQARAKTIFGDAPVLNREEAALQFRPALDLVGDPTAGKIVFTERCAVCHLPLGDNPAVGPVLNTFRAQGKAMLLENLISPNREVAPQYATWQLELNDGTQYTGLLARESADEVELLMPGVVQVVKRSDIKRLSNSSLSLMPAGLEAGLTLQQMADLLSYVKGEE